MVISKFFLAFCLAATPIALKANVSQKNEIFSEKNQSNKEIPLKEMPLGRSGKDGKDGKDGVDGINGTNGKDGKNGKDGVDGINGKDGECICNSLEIAHFYLDSSHTSTQHNNSLVIADRESIVWNSDVFTIKSSGINVKDELSIDLAGVYSIDYTVLASSVDPSINFYTFELQANDISLNGSRYTQILPLTDVILSNDPNNANALTLTRHSNQLQGHVVSYLPSGANLKLVNVSGHDVTLQDEGDRKGALASIRIQKLADSIE